MANTLYIMKGLPGSGKSVRAREIVAQVPDTIRVNMDDIRSSMFPGSDFSKKRERMVSSIRNELIQHGLFAGYNVVSDDTNLNPGTFAEVQGLADTAEDTTVEIVDFTDVPLVTCLSQNKGPGRDPVPEHVIHRMWVSYIHGLRLKGVTTYSAWDRGIGVEVYPAEDGTGFVWDVICEADPSLDRSAPLAYPHIASAIVYSLDAAVTVHEQITAAATSFADDLMADATKDA